MLGYTFGYTRSMTSTTLSISPWGNSQGIRLPRALLQALGLATNDQLQAHVVAPGRLELRAATKRLTLAQKLKRFDPAIHGGELFIDAPVGNEFGSATAAH
jgi:antitoxin MazE